MRNNLKQFVLLALIALIAAGISVAIAQNKKDQPAKPKTEKKPAPKKNTGMKVAYVNMLKVIQYYPRWHDEVELLKQDKDAYQKKLNEMEKEIKDLYDQLKPPAAPNPQKFTEWKNKKNFYEFIKKQWERKLQRNFRNMFKDIYEEVYDAIVNYAKEKQYDQVLGIAEREINVGTEAEFFQKVSLRAVIYYHKEDDITNEIIKKLGGDPNKKPGEKTKKKKTTTPEKKNK